MAPIRTAIIGLSASSVTSWASGAHLPYLLSPRGREKYTITALCNSSVDAAKKAISAYHLSPDTKAYGDPQSLADDPDIDLVVCATRVDIHHETALPSVRAGKSVFTEWPLAQDLKHVAELADGARAAAGSRSIVGLQGRLAPPVVRIRETLREGRIGKVLSAEARAYGGSVDRETLVSGLSYFTDRAVGGNIYTIGFGHLFDQINFVLGNVQHVQSRLQIQRPDVKLRDPETGETTETKRSNVPDLIQILGVLPESSIVEKNASISFRFRRGQPFPGDPALVWTINGTKGELRLVARGGTTLHASAYTEPVTIEVHDYATDKVEQVDWQWEDWQEELPIIARIIGKVYDEYAGDGRENVPTFEDAQKTHQQLEEILSGFEG